MRQGLGVSLDLQIVPYESDHVLSAEEIEDAKADLRKIFGELSDTDVYVIGIACQIKEVEVIEIKEYL